MTKKDINFSAYNIKNHRLSANELSQLNRFSTDDYCGVLSDGLEPNIFSGTKDNIIISDKAGNPISIVSDGIIFNIKKDYLGTILKTLDADTRFCYLMVNGVYSNTQDNIYSDNINTQIVFDSTVPTFENEDIVVFKIDNVTYKYKHQTIISGEENLIIPLFYIDDSGNIKSILIGQDKSSLEAWLNAKDLEKLWEQLHATFTHRAGSKDVVGYGELGNFDVKEDTIRHTNGSELKDTITVKDKDVILNQYKADNLDALYVDKDGKILHSELPIEAGGTNARNRQDAKINLGITYGRELPTDLNNYKVGDIFFKILT